jgi:hypothetical protein
MIDLTDNWSIKHVCEDYQWPWLTNMIDLTDNWSLHPYPFLLIWFTCKSRSLVVLTNMFNAPVICKVNHISKKGYGCKLQLSVRSIILVSQGRPWLTNMIDLTDNWSLHPYPFLLIWFTLQITGALNMFVRTTSDLDLLIWLTLQITGALSVRSIILVIQGHW